MSATTTRRAAVLGWVPARLGAPLGPDLATLAYMLRTMLAIGIALYVSFSLQLLSPMSSVTTVLIVANPVTGALVSKSLWRLFGTVLGATVAVALFAMFAQSPLLFTIALSLCIGIACMVSSLLRYFRAYGAVLAGYTIIIVASGSFADPTNIFIGALSRVSAVSVGIVSAALVFLLTALPIPATLNQTVESLVRDIAAGFVAFRRAGGPAPDQFDMTTSPRPALLVRAAALDEAIEYASADSYMLRRRLGRLRLGAARLLGLLSALEPLHDALRHDAPEANEAQSVARQTMQELSRLPPGGLADSLGMIEAARARVEALALALDDPAALTVALHERDMLEQLAHAVADLGDTGAADTRIHLRPFLEWPTAFRNALRGLLVTLIGGLFWYVTQWTAGPTLLSFLVPASCLLSTNPSASRASVELATGASLAILGSMLFQILLLPQITGYPLLWASLCLCLAPGIWLQFHPAHRNRAFGYVVFFTAMSGVRNPVTFDDITLLNNWLAFLMGSIGLVLVFRVLLPANPPLQVRRLAGSLGRAIEVLAWPRSRLPGLAGWRHPAWEIWQNLQMQKILRLMQRLQQLPQVAAAPLVQSAFVIVALGRVVLTLQELRRDQTLPAPARAAAARALRALRQVRSDPPRAAATIRDAAQAVLPLLHPGREQELGDPESASLPRSMRLLLGTLGEAALLVDRARALLDRRWSLATPDPAP